MGAYVTKTKTILSKAERDGRFCCNQLTIGRCERLVDQGFLVKISYRNYAPTGKRMPEPEDDICATIKARYN